MTDINQGLLAAIVVLLSVMISLIGVQFYMILKEFQNSIKKINKILDDAGVMSESVSKPLNALSTMLMGIKSGSTLWKLFKKRGQQE